MTATHHVHGLAGEQVAPDWPALTRDEVRAVLARLPTFAAHADAAQLIWHSPRPLSAAARVCTPCGELFVKRHHQRVRTAQELIREHAFAAHLRARGVPTVEHLADETRCSAWTLGAWTYEASRPASGEDSYRDTPSWTPLQDLDDARAAGRMLARLHRAAADFPPVPRHAQVLVARDEWLRADDPLAFLQQQCARRPGLASYLANRDWRAELAPLLPRHAHAQPHARAQPRRWTHNDWHVSNLFWRRNTQGAEVATVLDFGLAAPTFALYDLATAIERNAVEWLALPHGEARAFPATARALLAGYDEQMPLAAAERNALAELLPVVHWDFALSEVEYFAAIIGRRGDADVAWSVFLLGHTRWFDTAQGKALLAAVRAPA